MTKNAPTTKNTPLELQRRLRFSMKITILKITILYKTLVLKIHALWTDYRSIHTYIHTILKNSDLALKIPTFGYLAAALLRSAADPKVGIL